MSVKILFDGKEVGTIEADLHQITRESRQKKSAGVLLDYDGETTFDCTFSTDEFEKSMHNLKMSKEIKIWRGDKILCAFDKKDIAAINEIPGGSRLELADGSWFEIGKTVEYMKEILGVEEMK
ncbi:hypothetical protein ACYCLF_16765 [Bacillus velezensis]|uniref:hypothetical protein n=1 Tax=Bacillus velezensis TaxID=492670 RepID=UPI0030ECA6BA